MKKRPFEVIIFDHDGTLVDTESPDFQACKILCEEFGTTISLEQWAEKVVGHMDGYNYIFDEIIQTNNNGVTQTDLWRRLNELWIITLEIVELMPGVSTLLPQLKAAGYPLGVATASERDWAMRWLIHFDLESYFQVVVSGDDITHNKPAPDVYLYAATEFGVSPERCLVFEDSVAGMQSAKAAGMTVVAVPSHVTKSLDFSQADAIVEGLEKVTVDWIEEFGETLTPKNVS
jgi:HAD superfamily hydrolase (TIGR01509 family)